ncbi:MAG: hypothetical protein Q7K41_00705, partial [Dehalococcoidales bacterium]|nr:hypothetical protein [Dehalococcoidales bacterium]
LHKVGVIDIVRYTVDEQLGILVYVRDIHHVPLFTPFATIPYNNRIDWLQLQVSLFYSLDYSICCS